MDAAKNNGECSNIFINYPKCNKCNIEIDDKMLIYGFDWGTIINN